MTISSGWSSIFTAVCLTTLVTLLLQASRRRVPKCAPFPPGPTRLPLLGSVHLLPQQFQERTLAEWGKKYGGIVYAKLFRTPAIVINSYKIAHDLMEKRSGNYSDRPRFILIPELLGWKNSIVHLRYGDQFRMHRKWMQDAFRSKEALDSYRPIQRREVSVFLANLLSTPEAFMAHFTQFSASIIMEIVYGHRVLDAKDEFIGIAERAGEATVTAGSPATMLVDFFPIMKLIPEWCPGGGFKTKSAVAHKYVSELYEVPYRMVREETKSGTARPSFTSNLLERRDRVGKLTLEDEENIKAAAATVYSAGTETTATAMMTFILAMVRHPGVYSKLQDEVDRVVGPERLPDFEDRAALPYTECVIKELYRWHVPVPLGIPHNTLKSDIYDGYHIPENAMVVANIWAMSQDEDIYPNPTDFNPERYMDHAEEDPKNIVFGFGRRQCPGNELADRSIFILVTSIAATMNITKVKDTSGAEITPSLDFTSGFVSRPEAFSCEITARSDKAVRLIRQMKVATE